MRQELSVADLDRLVRESIARNSPTPGQPRGQKQLNRAVKALYEDGELELASCLLLCSVSRIQGRVHQVHQMLMQDAIDHRHVPPFGAAPGG